MNQQKLNLEAALEGLAETSRDIEPWDTSDMAHRSGGLSVEQEIERLTDLNKRLVAAAKALGAAEDVAEWDEAWSKIAKLFKESV
jgi:hypothetical protein